MAKIVRALDVILSHLAVLNRPVVDQLQPGLTREKIAQTLESEQITLPGEALDMWGWRNGTRIAPGRTQLDDIQFFPGFYFYSFEDALVQYGAMRNDRRWNKHWFPIFASGGGDFYALDVRGDDRDHAPIIGFILGARTHPVEYECLERMCETLATCFQRGVFFLSSDGFLEMDDDKHNAIARELNPSVALWSEA